MRQLWGNLTGNPLDPKRQSSGTELVRQRPDGGGRTTPSTTAASVAFHARTAVDAVSAVRHATRRPIRRGGNTALYGRHTTTPTPGRAPTSASTMPATLTCVAMRHRPLRPAGNIIGLSPEHSAGLRSFQDLGGPRSEREPALRLAVRHRQDHERAHAAPAGCEPWLNDPRMAASMVKAERGGLTLRSSEPEAVPGDDARRRGHDSDDGERRQLATSTRLTSSAVAASGRWAGWSTPTSRSLMDQMQQQGSKDLSLGLQDAQNHALVDGPRALAARRSRPLAGIWEDIQQKNALDRAAT